MEGPRIREVELEMEKRKKDGYKEGGNNTKNMLAKNHNLRQ